MHVMFSGMGYKWDSFVNAFDTHRYAASGLEGRENRHVMYVREFASTVSMLQVHQHLR